MASAFADLLVEARDSMRKVGRKSIALHFDWDGGSAPDSWKCWADDVPGVYVGMAGEESLRRLVEELRAASR